LHRSVDLDAGVPLWLRLGIKIRCCAAVIRSSVAGRYFQART
jgi:hypothetical protein